MKQYLKQLFKKIGFVTVKVLLYPFLLLANIVYFTVGYFES